MQVKGQNTHFVETDFLRLIHIPDKEAVISVRGLNSTTQQSHDMRCIDELETLSASVNKTREAIRHFWVMHIPIVGGNNKLRGKLLDEGKANEERPAGPPVQWQVMGM